MSPILHRESISLHSKLMKHLLLNHFSNLHPSYFITLPCHSQQYWLAHTASWIKPVLRLLRSVRPPHELMMTTGWKGRVHFVSLNRGVITFSADCCKLISCVIFTKAGDIEELWNYEGAKVSPGILFWWWLDIKCVQTYFNLPFLQMNYKIDSLGKLEIFIMFIFD